MQATIIYLICTNVFDSSIFESSGLSNDHWSLSVTIFTCVFVVVNNKILLTTSYFHPLYVFSVVFTWGFYFFYLWITDPLPNMVMQHFTFHRCFTSPLFYLTCALPICLCFYLDLLIQSVNMHLLTDPQSLIRLYITQHDKNEEFTEDFVEEFKCLTDIQQRFLVIDNYFKEEELEYNRQKLIQLR